MFDTIDQLTATANKMDSFRNSGALVLIFSMFGELSGVVKYVHEYSGFFMVCIALLSGVVTTVFSLLGYRLKKRISKRGDV